MLSILKLLWIKHSFYFFYFSSAWCFMILPIVYHVNEYNALEFANQSMHYITNRFHVAVHLSSNRSQMTSKCGKNKKVAHEAIVSRSTIILRRRKVEFINWINLRNVLLIGFVKFKILQWFTVYQDQFCVWLSLARLPTAGVFFFWAIF